MEDVGTAVRATGVIKFYNLERGYGFIRREGEKDAFLHAMALKRSGIKPEIIMTGDKVSFDAVPTDDKGPKAEKIELFLSPIEIANRMTQAQDRERFAGHTQSAK